MMVLENKGKGVLFGLLLLAALTACSSAPDTKEPEPGEILGGRRTGRSEALQQYSQTTPAATLDRPDPIEPVNRVVWDFNYEVLDRYLFRPVTRVYINYVPEFAKEGMNNMVRNLDEPSSTINHLLMGHGVQSGRALLRFVVNSSVGLLGFFDVAKAMGVSRDQAEFGDVLANLGAGEGAYVMLPVLGPTTILNEVGDFVDRAYFPYSYLTLPISLVRYTVDGLYQRAAVVNQEPLLDSALDPYLFVRDGYLQYRDAATGREIEQSPQEDGYLDDYLNELD